MAVSPYDNRLGADELDVRITDLLVASADSSDALIDGSVQETLKLLRERLQMDVLFVSEFVDGKRVFRFVDSAQADSPLKTGGSGPLDKSYCQLVSAGKLPESIADLSALAASRPELPSLPFRIGEHLSTPVVLKDGRVYGSLCCFSKSPNLHGRQRDLTQLKQCAQLVARMIDGGGGNSRPMPESVPDWSLSPVDAGRDVWKL